MATADVARSYHDRPKHTWRTVRAGGRELDWANRPVRFKLYPGLEPMPLPLDLAESDWPALDALSGIAPPNRQPLGLDRLAALLFHAAGVTRRWERGGVPAGFRAAPSAGALYPVELYVVCRDLPGLDAGLYHFEPVEFCLRRLRAGDLRGTLAGATQDADVGRAPLTLVATAIPHRSTWKYHDRGYRHLLWDAGTVLAHVLSLADAMAEPARVIAGFVDREVSHLVGLGDDELPLAVVPFGSPDPAGPTSGPPLPALEHRSAPISPRPAHQPQLLALHRAADLGSAPALARWRDAVRDVGAQTGPREVPTPLLGAFDTLEDVVLRRGSTRRFGHAPVPGEALTWPLAVAARPAPLDALADGTTTLEHHAVVHAVDGVEPGVHRWRPDGLALHRAGGFRDETTSLCLEQPLGGDGAYTVFHLAPLGRLLDRGGERAYRVAQLEAGIASGRVQLAAAALGIGATGLTFYDDDVVRFLDATAEPMLATAVGLPAYAPRPGARPGDGPLSPPHRAGADG
jgi:SagB-type dehydrogenase family enzyme